MTAAICAALDTATDWIIIGLIAYLALAVPAAVYTAIRLDRTAHHHEQDTQPDRAPRHRLEKP